MTVARTRIKRWRFKDSPLWVICLPDPPDRNDERVVRMLENIDAQIDMWRESGENFSGFVCMMWGDEMGTSVSSINFDKRIPSIVIPDLVRNRLIANVILKWAHQDFGEDTDDAS